MRSDSTIPSTEPAFAEADWHVALLAGQYRKASRLIRNARLTDSANPHLWYGYAYSLYRRGWRGRAKQAVLVAIRLADDQADFYALLARIYADQSRFEQAVYVLDCGLALDAANEECLWQKAEVLCRQFVLNETEKTLDRLDFYQEKGVLTASAWPVACFRTDAQFDPLLQTAFRANPFGTKTPVESLDTLVQNWRVLWLGNASNVYLGLVLISVCIWMVVDTVQLFTQADNTYRNWLPFLIALGLFMGLAVRGGFLHQPWLVRRQTRLFMNRYVRRKSSIQYGLTALALGSICGWGYAGNWLMAVAYVLLLMGVLVLAWDLVPLLPNPNRIPAPRKRWWAKTTPTVTAPA